MHIRTALPVIIIFLLLAIAGGLIVSMQTVMLPGLEGMEASYATENLERAVNAIEDDGRNLQIVVNDWASWDDTYQYIEDKNERYIKSNIVDSTFTINRLNFIIYFDTKGDIVFGEGFDYKEELEEIEIPSQLTDQLRSLDLVGNTGKIAESHNGLIALPESPLLIATAPILRSDDSGLPRGTLVMARYFDHDEINRISDIVSIPISLYPVGSGMIYRDLAMENIPDYSGPIVAVSNDGGTIAGITWIKDIGGQPGYAIRVDMDREAYSLGLESMFLFLFVVALVGVISTILVIVVVRNKFIKRLESFESQIEEIGQTQDIDREVKLGGNDELTSLSHIFNRMLESLKEHISEQKQAEEQARIATDKLHLLTTITRHDILNQIMVIQSHTDLLLETRKEDPQMLEHVKKIDQAVENINEFIGFTRDYEKMGAKTPTWHHVQTLLEDVIKKFDPGDMKIEIDVGALEIFADPLFERVFYNIIDNSLRHGGDVGRITVSSHQKGNHLVLVFEDDGVGVSPELKDRLFEKGVGKNTGLGLFLSREILGITGITIAETGTPGMGARIEMDVPPGSYRYT